MSKKIYVVWKGKENGVFTDWQQCKDSIDGFKGAKYKSFKSLDTANKAFKEGYEFYWGQETKFESELSEEQLQIIGRPIYPSVSVDAAWNTATLHMEY
jgi:ribonuclease HI